tara:strand:+ start:85568 stop:87676 length:2109 start_codon:yes stop_codon:yes gene_type:complete
MQNPLELLKFSGRKRLPVILQTEVAECGLACMAMIASYHGHEIDLNTLRRQYPVSLRGTTLQNLMQVADKMEFATRPLRLEIEDMPQLQTPTILHWDMNHFVVLKRVSKKSITIHDPAQGTRTVSMKEVSKHFTGIALELTPTKKFEPKKEVRKVPIWNFWHRIVGLKKALIQVFMMSVALQIFALLSPLYMQLVVDEVLLSRDLHLLTVLAIGFGILMLINIATTALRSLVVLSLSSMLSIQMAANLFRHLIRLPLPFFEKRHIGDIVSRFGSLGQIEKALTTNIVQAIVDGLMAIATLVMIFFYSPALTAVVLIALALYGIIRCIWYRPLKSLTEEGIVTAAKENSNFMETIRGVQSIKVFGQETQRQTLWQNRYADKINAGIRLGKLNIAFSSINSLLFGLENIIVVYLAAHLVVDVKMTVGMLYAFMSYKSQFTDKAVAFIEKLIEFKMLGLHLERLGDIALEEQEIDSSSMLEAPELKGAIQLENLSFRYNQDEPWVFQNVSLTIEPGESIALIGPSGCGKTTLMKVMMGLFQPETGKVMVDNMPLDTLGHKHFRDQFGAVMQDDQLLSGSIGENISFFAADFDQARVELCANMAVIAQDIMAMPMNYNTLMGDMGMALSGGQKQRVLLARALYKNPKILFLDEATSHLDVALEKGVNDAVKNLKVTRVIIAHRPETIRSADRVFLMTPEGLVEQPK